MQRPAQPVALYIGSRGRRNRFAGLGGVFRPTSGAAGAEASLSSSSSGSRSSPRGCRPGARVLDVGCGEGWFCGALAQRGFAVGRRRTSPRRRCGALGRACPEFEFAVCEETRLPFGDGSFEVAWLGEVLEHVRDGIGLLAEVARVVGPGGRLLASTPDHAVAAATAARARSPRVRAPLRAARRPPALLHAAHARGSCWTPAASRRSRRAPAGARCSSVRALDELQREARARLGARPEVAGGAEHERLGELLAAVGAGEAHAGRAQRRGERVEVVDLERHVIEALRRAFERGSPAARGR